MSSSTTDRKSNSGRRKRPVTPESKRFGNLIAQARKTNRCRQAVLAANLGVSFSFLGKIERGEANHAFTREQVWEAIKLLNIWPPKCDEIMETAGFGLNRTAEEELYVQQTFPDLREVWVFARHILDTDEPWLTVVKNNIERGVAYRYFIADDISFIRLLAELRKESSRFDESRLSEQLECFVLPKELFFTNVAIYNPGSANMYCCGAKTLYGRSEFFFTNHESEGHRIYVTLRAWADRIRASEVIGLMNIERVFPEHGTSDAR